MKDELDFDPYEDYAEQFEPRVSGRSGPKPGKPKSRSQIVAELAEPTGLEAGFETTYAPARYEKEWLLASLRPFYDEHLITDVLAQVKGGKEASVYRCAADPSTGAAMLAAKVYRPRMFRNLRNDKVYRDGRAILTSDGRPVKKTDHRIMRAVGKKTAFGAQVQHTSWIMYEYTTMERLRQAGAAVPPVVAPAENAILMGYCGDERRAAPTLNEVGLPRKEAAALFQEVLRNIELMLEQSLIHGDLSAYNILYWDGRITIIDFPQVTDVRTNRQAEPILRRDIRRVCEYFARQGVHSNPDAIMADLWDRYGRDLAAEQQEYIEPDGSTDEADDEY